MSGNTGEAAPEKVELPADAKDLWTLCAMYRLPRQVSESIMGLLREQGHVYTVGKVEIVSQAKFLAVLSDFCNRVPGAAGMVADYRDRRLAYEREQGQIEATQRRTMEAMMRDPFDKGPK